MNLKAALVLLLFLCAGASAQNTTSISGTTDNSAASAKLVIDRLHLNVHPDTLSSAVANGNFQFTLSFMQKRILEFWCGNFHQKIFIEPGDNMYLQVRNNALVFAGNGAAQNNFMKEFFDTFKNDFDDSITKAKILSTPVDAYEISLYDNRKKQAEFFRKYPGQEKFTAAFNEFMQNVIDYNYWNLLLAYPIVNANSDQKNLTVNALPSVMLDGFDKVKVNNDAALECEPYRKFLKYYVTYFTSEKNGFKKFTDFSVSAEKKETVAQERLTGIAFKYWLAQFLIDECGRLSPFMTKKLYNDLKLYDKEEGYAAAVNEVCGEKMAMREEKKKEIDSKDGNTTAVSSSDVLDLSDRDGKHVSLSDFKGKVVYIDFWASWCGPCRGQMPFSKQLHEKFSDKQKKKIVFLYISIDADPARWRKGIEELGIEGVNVNSPGNWGSRVCSYFQINSIPRYMIMNKKGEIVDFNAKRPSDPAVFDDLIRYSDE